MSLKFSRNCGSYDGSDCRLKFKLVIKSWLNFNIWVIKKKCVTFTVTHVIFTLAQTSNTYDKISK